MPVHPSYVRVVEETDNASILFRVYGTLSDPPSPYGYHFHYKTLDHGGFVSGANAIRPFIYNPTTKKYQFKDHVLGLFTEFTVSQTMLEKIHLAHATAHAVASGAPRQRNQFIEWRYARSVLTSWEHVYGNMNDMIAQFKLDNDRHFNPPADDPEDVAREASSD